MVGAIFLRQFSAAESTAADINQDGKINAVDARWILQIASGRRLALMLDTQTDYFMAW